MKSLKSKIIIPTVVVLTVLVVLMLTFSSARFSRLSSDFFLDRLNITSSILKSFLTISERESRAAVVSLSKDADVIEAVRERDREAILSTITDMLGLYSVNFCTVTDATGTVLARTHKPEMYGDSVLGQQNIIDALNGKVSTYCEQGTEVLVSIRTGAPICDTDGSLIGVLSAGVRLDTNEAVDILKERYNSDFSVFYGDTRISTTIFRDGNRMVGTKLDPEIAKISLEQGEDYYGDAYILGESYNTCYMPLRNAHNEVFAIMSVVKSNTALISEKNSLVVNGIVSGLGGLAFAIIILLFIITKITNPVKRLTGLVSSITHGDVDVDLTVYDVTKDEIGTLINNTYTLADTIKAMLNDLSMLTHEMNTFSDIKTQINTGEYEGAYKEIACGINDLANSISMMKKTMTVMDSLVSMIIVVDFEYNLVYINRSLADTFNMDIECYKGEKCYKATRGLDQPCPFCLLPSLLPDKDSFPSQAYEFLHDDVNDMWMGGQASIIRWVDGTMVYFQSLNDETQKKLDQVALQNAVRTAEIASNAKSSFLANMSHELRTPLNVVIGLADLQLESEALPGDARESLEKISNAGDTLLSIVNDILDISKIESGNFILICVDYHMASLLNDTVSLITSRIGETPVSFSLDIDDDLLSVLHGDDLRVKQVLNNLLSNAIKYTHSGNITLRVRCAREDDDVWMEIAVTDTGIGIRPEDLEKLFSDYSQVDTQANRKSEGTGLGLAITKKLVESMDGEISVESEYGKGSSFNVKIRQGFVTDTPIGPSVAEDLRKARYSNKKRQISKMLVRANLSYAKVLVVDDMQINLDVSAGLMRKYMMQVDCVTSGQAAVERIKYGQPVYNAVFMDHMMPGMDGVEATGAIRALGTDYARTVPIIALTANAIAGTDEYFYENGFQAFISKPINVMQLDSVIQQWVRDKTQEDPMDEFTAGFASSVISAEGPYQEVESPGAEISGIDVQKGLSFFDADMDFYTSALRTYAEDTPALIERVRGISDDSLPDYTIAVHSLKSSSAIIGAETVRELAANLEAMAKKGDLQGILAINDSLVIETERLLDAINEWLDDN